jgi:hypothetical protein
MRTNGRTDRRRDRHDETKCRFLQFSERALRLDMVQYSVFTCFDSFGSTKQCIINRLKLSLFHAMSTYNGSSVIASHVLNLGAGLKWVAKFRAFWGREKSRASAEIRNPDRPAITLVAIQTAISAVVPYDGDRHLWVMWELNPEM